MVAGLLILAKTAIAYPSSYSLDVPNIKQEKDQWCWAGTSVSVLKYYGKSISQTSFVNTVKGATLNQPATMYEVKRGLNYYGLNSSVSESPMSFSTLISNIYNSEKPVMPLIQWTTGGGHFVNIDGYDDGSTDYITYMDPWYGDHYVKTYNSFKNSSTQTWYGQVYNFTAF
jgi:ABC-type bacteriocin/lantibiotic exporter with double-glycine peptidase domain